ncbi:MAG TPA: hypothetical protein VN901_20220 [Candidatus Acidoferrales bacterium]|nr:hypothetical protein [Candidatus Acidoferrales bacterium]
MKITMLEDRAQHVLQQFLGFNVAFTCDENCQRFTQDLCGGAIKHFQDSFIAGGDVARQVRRQNRSHAGADGILI